MKRAPFRLGEYGPGAKLNDVTIRDLRRTVGALMTIDGVNLPTVGRVRGNVNLNATQIYARPPGYPRPRGGSSTRTLQCCRCHCRLFVKWWEPPMQLGKKTTHSHLRF